jgi:hypothetical protein
MRVFLTVQQRNDLRVHAKENPQMTQFDLLVWLQRTCGKHVGRSTIGKIINSKIEETLNDSQQRRRKVQHPEMESALYDFIYKSKITLVLVTSCFGLKPIKFSKKQSWFENFIVVGSAIQVAPQHQAAEAPW